MARKKLMSKLGALIVIALLASGASAVHAEENYVSNMDALNSSVVLYERLCNTEVSVPSEFADSGLDEGFLKSVVLGYANLDDSESVAEAASIRKQDMINILYKTVINYDDSYAITGNEADAILNNCYDNAYIDERNRVAYAFMIKQGVVSPVSSEPDKALTEEGCRALIDEVYNFFAKKITFSFGELSVTTGANISTVTEVLGQPNRIDESLYGYKWYIYNSDPSNYMMVGVMADRICAVYSNSTDFEIGNVHVGDGYIRAADYKSDKNFTFYTDNDGNIDAILYNVSYKEAVYTPEAESAAALQILDMVNCRRARNGLAGYIADDTLGGEADLLIEAFNADGIAPEGIDITRGFDPFCVYSAMIRGNSPILTDEFDKPLSVGVGTMIGDDYELTFSICTGTEAPAETVSAPPITVDPEAPAEVPEELEEVTTPVIVTPSDEFVFEPGEDVAVELAMRAATQYHVEIFDVENDGYVVNEYIKTDKTQISLPAELFKRGTDYRMIISSITPDGMALASEDILFSYGTAAEDGVHIKTPCNGSTDDDYLAVSWDSEQFHDFLIDLYDGEGRLVTSEIIKDAHEAVIRGVDPGTYYIYVTALRRDTNIEKAQDWVKVVVNMPAPVITETILDEDDEYYFIYDDNAMGVLYFYDEEIVDVKEKNSRGEIVDVKKKKIIQKQVKATKAYRDLAKNRVKLEKVSGRPTLDFLSSVEASEIGQKIVNEASKYLGVPYVWGGTTPNGFDCSGLVQYVLRDLGINISRVTQTQCMEGVPVAKGDLQPGDLVFFEKNGDVHHVGIYVGNGQMLHAPHTGDVVRVADMNTPYYQSTYYGARRVYK